MKKLKSVLCMMSIVLLHHTVVAQIDLVYDLNPTGTSLPATLTEFQCKLYFSASTPATGRELYSYDGVNPPTLVTDFFPGSDDGILGTGNFAVIGDYMYLTAFHNYNGMELYRFDGTDITLVVDINSGTPHSNPVDFTVHNNVLYFSAETTALGRGLYKYTPATNALQRISDIIPRITTQSAKDQFGILGNKIFIATQGAGSDTRLAIYDIPTNSVSELDIYLMTSPLYAPFKYFHIYNNEIYFTGYDGTGELPFLYKHNGTDLIKLTGYVSDTDWAGAMNIVGVYNNKLYLSGFNQDFDFDMELFEYNPTTTLMNDISLVYNINSTESSFPRNGILYNGLLYFVAYDGIHGAELWSTDGTTTEMVMNLNPEVDDPTGYANIMFLTVFKGKLYMTASNASSGYELFVLETASTGIRNVMYDGNINVFPNPATNLVHINIEAKKSETLSLSIFDINGRKIHSQSLLSGNRQQNFSIPIDHWNAGTYIYTIKNENGITCKSGKIIKQ